MADFTQDERREGLGVAARIEEMALSTANLVIENELHRAAHRIRRAFRYSRDRKKIEILRMVKSEPLGLRLKDMTEALGFHIDDVKSLVIELENDGKIACRQTQPAGSRGGRPALEVVAIDHLA